MANADLVNPLLDEFVLHVQAQYKAFILARTCHVLGTNLLEGLADDALVTATIGLNVTIEPLPVSELRKFRQVYPEFVIDVFHGKIVQHWQGLLGKLFAHYVDLHLSGVRAFTELESTQTKVDFRLSTPDAGR